MGGVRPFSTRGPKPPSDGHSKSRGNPNSAGHGENCMSSVSPVRELAVYGPTLGHSYTCGGNLSFRWIGLYEQCWFARPSARILFKRKGKGFVLGACVRYPAFVGYNS